MTSLVSGQAIPACVMGFSLLFRSLFSHNQLSKFQQYLTGLVVSENKNILSLSQFIDRASTYDHLHHFVSESVWTPDQIADKTVEIIKVDRRLAPLPSGWLVVDGVLLIKTGKDIEFVGKLFDHAEHRFVEYAHCLVNLWYVDARGVQYPLKTELYIKEPLTTPEHPFKTKHEIARELMQWAFDHDLPCHGVLFDGWYLNEPTVSFLENLKKSWVSRMKSDMKLKDGKETVASGIYAKEISDSNWKETELEEHRYRYFSKTFKVPALKRNIRLVFLQEWNKDKTSWSDTVILATNEVAWHSGHILKSYRMRWSIETFHRDSKQHLGLGQYQMRRLSGISRRWSLVFVAYLFLVKMRRSSRLVRSLERSEQTIGALCSSVKDHITELLVRWVHDRCQKGIPISEIVSQMKLNSPLFTDIRM